METQESPPIAPPPEPKPPLTYEETPIITPHESPHKESAPIEAEEKGSDSSLKPSFTTSEPTHHPQKSSGFRKLLGNVVFFVILFGLGIWLSTQVRSLMSPPLSDELYQDPAPTEAVVGLGGVPSVRATPSAVGKWQSHQVLSGAAKTAIPGVVFELPPGIDPLLCDGTNCPSQGTNLPGGTRFTVAARGSGYALPDFRGAILTDAAGREFTMKQSTIGGKSVYEYVGNFTGSTGGGYSFTKMRGVLVPVTSTTSVELNHFAPTGETTDFAADDVLFEQIIATLSIPQTTPQAQPTVAPSPTGASN